MTDSLVIDRIYRPQIKATKQTDGSVIVHAGRSWMQFDADNLHELYAYAADRPTIQRYPVMAAAESPQNRGAGQIAHVCNAAN